MPYNMAECVVPVHLYYSITNAVVYRGTSQDTRYNIVYFISNENGHAKMTILIYLS